ncbi:GNAT family N-acetyltransferase [Microbacterium sp. VKM Ac-2870]|uniref:GNAT family N-acetyltransferase n=1 Tax=Microbacterium sp. VKM Ac-2870 TaxID=2783825 RepID=UPI00188D819D|nr:GNAT family N-acetyltransferase [Microbacterium sp. VKM Ac-2870]MBF4562260.1 GNAT family N-acetyltransferase [Microbacterium sp. VKM Ac-2870]
MLERLKVPVSVATSADEIIIRRAHADDARRLMELLADDPISASRGDIADDSDGPVYAAALERVIADAANDLVVAVDAHGAVVGTLQLTLIPGMARRGSTRLLVEAVRVASAQRGAGVGGAMMRWVTERAAVDLGAHLVQLTSDAARVDAHRFYERLGFVGSHVGFKYRVPPAAEETTT